MDIPTFVQGKPLDENGNWTRPWQMLWEQLLQNMQQNLSEEGFHIPNQPTINITQLTLDPGTIIYDSTLDEFKGQVGATLKTFTLT